MFCFDAKTIRIKAIYYFSSKLYYDICFIHVWHVFSQNVLSGNHLHPHSLYYRKHFATLQCIVQTVKTFKSYSQLNIFTTLKIFVVNTNSRTTIVLKLYFYPVRALCPGLFLNIYIFISSLLFMCENTLKSLTPMKYTEHLRCGSVQYGKVYRVW